MKGTKHRFLRNTLIVVGILVIGIFVLNWYLKYRLENYLKEVLSEKVSDATDGFYDMTFNSLSIGLFSGELSIKGIDFHPNPEVLARLSQNDSLPNTYLNIKVGLIHFEGVNLTWRRNYKELNFKLFEVANTDIEIYETQAVTVKKKPTNMESLPLYEIISPYINELSVNEINLTNASISYFTADDTNPSVYALKNVNFHASGFILDEHSTSSGKLLYSDNFNFSANEPQILLSNNQFTLNTNNILLNTTDSIIRIEGIKLLPRKDLWAQMHQTPDAYIDAYVDAVAVKGLRFTRENFMNYLDAKVFEIDSSDVKYFTTKKDHITEVQQNRNKDTLNLSWSLYSIVSPIFKEVAIDSIDFRNAKFKYSETHDSDTSVYTLNKLEFQAINFMLDSLSGTSSDKRFLYSKNMALQAHGIRGIMPKKNYIFGVDLMLASTITRKFLIENITLGQFSHHHKHDYISGNIVSVSLDSIRYNGGIEASLLSVNNPSVEYVRIPDKGFKSSKKKLKTEQSNTVWAQVLPFIDQLLVRNVAVNDGNIVFTDKATDSKYNISQFNFYAKDILISQQVVDSLGYFFAYDDFGFSFKTLDGLLPNRQYRLQAKNAAFYKKQGYLNLHNLKLIPQVKSWKVAPNTYYDINIPIVEGRKLSFNSEKTGKDYKVGSLLLKDPHIKIEKISDNSSSPKQVTGSTEMSITTLFNSLFLGSIDIKNANIEYINKPAKDSIKVITDKLLINNFLWDVQKPIRIEEILLSHSNLAVINNSAHSTPHSQKEEKSATINLSLKGINIDRLSITDFKTAIVSPDLNIKADMDSFLLRKTYWSPETSRLGKTDILNPNIQILKRSHKSDNLENKSNKHVKNPYSILGTFTKEIFVDELNIVDANIDYNQILEGRRPRQQLLNQTTLKLSGFWADSENKTSKLEDLDFNTKNFHLPIDNGFYTLEVGEIDLNKKKQLLSISKFHMIPAYPKMVFAYKNPKHKDWFDIKFDSLSLSGIDFPLLLSKNIVKAKQFDLFNPVLLNFKNQKIEIEHRPMPLVYEVLQKAPIKVDIDSANVNNFKVVYEELPKNGNKAGKLFITNLNGRISDLTNIVTSRDQYINIDADGKFMGTGDFTAKWMIPVDSLNDCFILEGNVSRFELKDLNQLIMPLGSAEVQSGIVNKLVFRTEASSFGASVDMLFLYNDLKVEVFKNKGGELTPNKFTSGLANLFLKHNNPDKKNRKPRQAHATLERATEHSTFNYFWQILQPPLVESVGISEKTQNFAKKIVGFFGKVQQLLKKPEKPEKTKEEEDKK